LALSTAEIGPVDRFHLQKGENYGIQPGHNLCTGRMAAEKR